MSQAHPSGMPPEEPRLAGPPPAYSGVRSGAGCGRMAGIYALLAVGTLALLLSYVGWTIYQRWQGVLDRADERIDQITDFELPSILPTPRPTPTPYIETASVMAQRLRGASELTTAIYTMDTVTTASQDRMLGQLTVGTTELIYVAHGQVRAGIELAEIGTEDIDADVEAGRLVVRLPAPRILDRKIDVEKSYVYDLDRSLFGPVDPTLQTQAEGYALEQIWRSACENGILAQANERGSLAVEKLLETAGYDEVVVITSPAHSDECPPDATPTAVATGAAATEQP